MKITQPMVLGAGIALAGHVVAVGVTYTLGGGPDADLESGGRFAALFVAMFVYGIAQLVLLLGLMALSGHLGRGASTGLTAGWVLGLAVSLLHLCGGFDA
ncbi:MAG TPA: hypothetical protein VGD43_17305 [Micromonospora sp.]